MHSTTKFMPERTGRTVRFGKGKGWKSLISVQFLPAGQPAPDNKEISVRFRTMQQATARAAAESEQRDLWNRAGTENMPCKPLPGTCHTPSERCRPGGLSPGTALAHVIQQVGRRPLGLSEMKENPVLTQSEMSVPPPKFNKCISIYHQTQSPWRHFFLQVLLFHTHQKEFSYLLYPTH